jgi:hypothetical protein
MALIPQQLKKFMRCRYFTCSFVVLGAVLACWLGLQREAAMPSAPAPPSSISQRLGPHPAESAVQSGKTGVRPEQAPAGKPEPEAEVTGDAVADFSAWSVRYLAATPAQRLRLESEGAKLAATRRGVFQQLIRSDPQRALELAVPRVVRQDLPAAVVALLEKPVSAKGDLNVYQGRPAPGVPVPEEGLVLRYFQADGVSYRAQVYGGLKHVASRKGVPLRGVAIDRDLAVADNAVRRLEVGEQIPAGTIVEESCPVSGKETATLSSGEVVTAATPVVEIADRTLALCEGEHVALLESDFKSYLLQASGPGSSSFFLDNFPGTSSRAIGNLRCLYIRATYPEQMVPPNTEEQAFADMRDNARFFLENSYGKMTQTATVTATVVMPRTMAWYKAKDGLAVGGIDGLWQVHLDARAAAQAMGYDTSNYDCYIVRINGGPKLEGISWGGGENVWLTWDGMDVINHEVGHSLGRDHANFWDSLDGTGYGHGQNAEYGNPFDTMGGGNGFSAHYNSISKRALAWLPDSYVHQVKGNGVYRVFAYDQPTLEEGKRYALTVPKDNVRRYNLEYHPARGGLLADNALVIYSGIGSNAGHLVDTTPGSSGGKNDAGIAIGRTFSDHEADMHFTVLGKNPTTPPSLDIAFNRGPFPGNLAPSVTLSASATTIAAGASVTFTANATDPNGDALAYQWEFDDGVAGTNSASFTRTFPSVNQINVMLSVTDMKGGVTRRSVVVNVGAHGKQAITGAITLDGVPLQGATVAGGGKKAISNADGTYTLAGLTTGSKTLTCALNGYTFSAQFTNPLTVISGPNTADWKATGATFIKLTTLSDAAEGGPPGKFRLTRSGDTSGALKALVSRVGGTATKGTDYTFAPDYVASGSYYAFTLPAGSATLDILVNAVNTSGIEDSLAEGPETITLQLTSAPGYLSNSGNAALMTIADNDTTLPQVRVAAPDPYAIEGPGADGGIFSFKRTGDTSAALVLNVAWSGSASNGTDYTLLPASVTIPEGQASVDLAVTPTNDTLIETPEELIATINANAGYVLEVGASSATVTISDDDTPVVSLSVPDPDAAEAGMDSGVVLFTRSGSLSSSLKVYYGVSGSALHGTDYAAIIGEVVIPAGASSAPVVISPYDDDVAEPAETVTLAIANFNNSYSIGASFQGVVSIADNNDLPVISARAGSVGTEGGTNPTVIFQSTGSTAGVTINYSVGGTASSGADFSSLSGSITIPSGSKQATLTIPLINDLLAEPTETVLVTITPSPNYRAYNGSSAEAIIRDNDSGGERVMVSTYNHSPTEAGTSGTFYLSRVGTSGNLTVSYALSGTATNSVDYQTLPGSVVIPDGQSGVNLVMTPINDTLAEGTETVTLSVIAGAGYSPDRPASASFQIADNEAMPITVGFGQTSLLVSELPGPLGEYRDVPVVLSAASATSVTVNFASAGGTAVGDDVDWAFIDADNGNQVISGGTLTFLPGIVTQNIRLRIKDDGVAEGNETLILALRGARGAGITSGRGQLTVGIFDSELPSFVTEERWNSAAVYTNNTWGSATPNHTGLINSFTPPQNVGDQYSRRLVGQVVAPVTGLYTFWISSDGPSRLYLSTTSSAAQKVQIAQLASTSTYQDWDSNPSQKSVAINLTAGQSYYMEVQQQETTGVDHVSVAWQGLTSTRMTISLGVPNSAARTVRFLKVATTRLESDGSEPLLQVVLDRPAGLTPVTVAYSTAGTATAGSDYTLAPGILTFNFGEQMKPLPLALISDALSEDPETIIVLLANPTGAILAAPGSHTITLTDVGSGPAQVQVAAQFVGAASSQVAGTVIATASATVQPGRSVASWSIVSGNSGNAFGLNNAGQLTLITPGALPNPGGMQLIIRATDNLGTQGDGAINVICNAGTKAVVEQRWSGSDAFAGEDWRGTPSFSGTLATLTTGFDAGDNYSRRLTGFLKPLISGSYTFWVAGDDDCRLYLSTDGYQANKVLIASVDGWTGFQEWDNSAAQKSVTIPLLAGKVYWIEAQEREGSGGDHVSVAWSGPGIARAAIPASAMLPTVAGINFLVPGSGAGGGGNSAPTITTIANRNINEDTSTGALAFTLGDADTGPGSLAISASSSDIVLVPNSKLILGGTGASRTLQVTPALHRTGSATITLTASDGMLTTTRSFVLTVNPVNDPPSISAMANQGMAMNSATGLLPLWVEDAETAANALQVTATSSNTLLVPVSRVVFAGAGVARTVKVSPAANQVGSATVTLKVTDGTASTSTSFVVTVTGSEVQTWRQSHFATAGNTGTAANTADPDGDGISNLAEYALNLPPLVPNVPGSNVLMDQVLVAGKKHLRLSIAKNSVATEVTFTVEATNDFSNPASWTSVGTTIETNTSTALVVRDSSPVGTNTKRYMRLRMTAP